MIDAILASNDKLPFKRKRNDTSVTCDMCDSWRFLQKKDEGSMKGEKKGSQEDEEG